MEWVEVVEVEGEVQWVGVEVVAAKASFAVYMETRAR